jgi:hypothetical protein
MNRLTHVVPRIASIPSDIELLRFKVLREQARFLILLDLA